MRKQIILPLLFTLCHEMGIEAWSEPTRGVYGYLVLPGGRKFYLKDINFNINLAASVSMCKNKAACSEILSHLGYAVPEFTMVRKNGGRGDSLEAGASFLASIGCSAILKPNNLSQGRLIYKIHDEAEYHHAAQQILQVCDCFQVQRFYPGNDYRLVVLGGQVISAYQRIPFHVVGDGNSSIEQLVAAKQVLYADMGRDTVINCCDERIACGLRRRGLSLHCVPSKGEKVTLQDISNLSVGGETLDLTDSIHTTYKELAKNISQDLNLDLCGIDLIADDIASSLREYVVLEVNTAPGLDNYAFQGKQQEEYVKGLYRQIVEFIIQKYS